MQVSAAENGKSRNGLAIRPWEGLLLGLIAGLIMWIVIQAVHPVFRVPKKFDVPSIGMPTEMFLAHRREQDRIDRWNAALYLGGLGLLVSVGIGAREAAARRHWFAPVVGAPLSALGGAAGGVLGCMVLQHVRMNVGQVDVMHAIGAQLAAGAPTGFAVGLSAGLMTGAVLAACKYLISGLAGGLIAAVGYSLAIALFMPGTNTDVLLPEEAMVRLLWLTMLGGTIGLAVPLAGGRRG